MMKSTIPLLLISAAVLSSAQVTVNSNGTYTCAIPNAAYCAGVTGNNNIIIRCVNGTGQPGNCNDNLAGYAPLGVSWSPCWQSSPTSGNAACSKNGTVYPESGSKAIWNTTAPFPIPGSVASNASSNALALSTITMTSIRTRTHYTTVTTYIQGNGTSSSGHWTTYTTPVSSPAGSVTAGPVSISAAVSNVESTTFTTIATTVNTTVCPESSTSSFVSGPVSSSIPTSTSTSSRIASSSSSPSPSMSAIASPVTPSGPVFTLPVNSTTLNLGPGPVSLSSYMRDNTAPSLTSSVANATAAATLYSSAVVSPVYNSSSASYLPVAPTTMQTSAGTAAFSASANATAFASASLTTSAGPLTYTGAAVKNVDANGMALAAIGIFAVALL